MSPIGATLSGLRITTHVLKLRIKHLHLILWSATSLWVTKISLCHIPSYILPSIIWSTRSLDEGSLGRRQTNLLQLLFHRNAEAMLSREFHGLLCSYKVLHPQLGAFWKSIFFVIPPSRSPSGLAKPFCRILFPKEMMLGVATDALSSS